VIKIKKIKDFDKEFTLKIIPEFETLENYYNVSSSIHYLKDVQIPLLLINSKDDPIISDEMIPYEEIKKNKNIFLITTEMGGHGDFIEGYFFPNFKTSWIEKFLLQYFDFVSIYFSKQN
jgi:uncharacterized protein